MLIGLMADGKMFVKERAKVRKISSWKRILDDIVAIRLEILANRLAGTSTRG